MKRFKKKLEARKTSDRLLHDSTDPKKRQGGASGNKNKPGSKSRPHASSPATKSTKSTYSNKPAVNASMGMYSNNIQNTSSPSSPHDRSSGSYNSITHPMTPQRNLALSPNSISRPPPLSLPRLSEGLPPFDYGQAPIDSMNISTNTSTSSTSHLNNSNANTNAQSPMFMSQPTRSNWDVQDTKLTPIPPLYPPIPPNCTTYIGDTSATPSIIASRISECLRKRSMVVEFDSECSTPTATCLNQDGVLFVVCLYRGGKGVSIGGCGQGQSVDDYLSGSASVSTSGLKSGSSLQSNFMSSTSQDQEQPDFSHGVIVECMRVRGDLNSFYRDCQAVLTCASGDSDGLDDLRSHNVALLHSTSGFGCRASRAKKPFGKLTTEEICQFEEDQFPRLVDIQTLKRNRSPRRNAKNDADVTLKALGSVLEMVEKDRMDARLLGMESLVLLTDVRSSGLERAYLASLSILGSSKERWKGVGVGDEGNRNMQSLSQLQERLILYAIGKFTQISTQAHLMAESDEESYYEEDPCDIVTEYNIKIRRCAMQALTNAMYNVVHFSDNFPLLPKPSCEEFMTSELLDKIGDDLRGATRPPMASLGSAHEAAYAAKFIHLIASYSEEGFRFVNGAVVGTPARSVYGLLDMAREAGSSGHRALEIESQLAQATIANKI